MKVSYVHLIGSLRSSCRIPEYDGNNSESSVPLPILESHSSNSPLCLLSSKGILNANLGKPKPQVLTRSSKVAAWPPCLQLYSLIKRSKHTVLKIQYSTCLISRFREVVQKNHPTLPPRSRRLAMCYSAS